MLTLKVIGRKNPKTGQLAYYPGLKGTEPKDYDTFVDEIARESTVTRPDVVATLSALEEQVKESLQEGLSVRLGLLGSFHLTAQATGEAKAEDVTPHDITAVRIQFTPDSVMKEAFELANNANLKLVMK